LETKTVGEQPVTKEAATQARSPSLQPGQTLRERYQVLRVLGTGGMSAVYEARDLTFPNVVRLCAIKEIYGGLTHPSVQAQRRASFEREVDILASLSHPAIPKIYEYFTEDQRCYLVLELIRGQDLGTFLTQSGGPLPERTVVRWAMEICEVLQYLHSRQPEQIVFRDMKPSNVMLNEHGRIVLVDFGIAKVFRDEKRGTMIGTEGFSPPEQYRGEATPQGDVYALGATMHHLLSACDPTREAPFSFHERPLNRFNPTVTPEIEAIIERALAYDARDRFANVAEMRAALEATLPRAAPAPGAGRVAPAPAAGPIAPAEGEVEPVWSFQCEDEIRSSPRVGQGMVYIGCYDNNLYALEANSGKFQWKYATEGGIAATPTVWEDLVLIGSEDFTLYAVAARTGRPSWTCATKGRIRSSARMAYEHAFLGSDDNAVYGVQARTGRIIWKSPTEGQVRSTPLISDEGLYIGCEDGYVYSLHLRRGSLQWRHYCGGPVTSSPVLWEGLLIVGSVDHYVYALDLNSGMPIWRYRTGKEVISSPALWDEIVYVGSADGCLYALDASGGRLRWKFETGGQVNSSPCVTREAAYVGSADGYVYAVETRTGKLRWKFKTNAPVVSSPAMSESTVFIGSLDGRLYALPA